MRCNQQHALSHSRSAFSEHSYKWNAFSFLHSLSIRNLTSISVTACTNRWFSHVAVLRPMVWCTVNDLLFIYQVLDVCSASVWGLLWIIALWAFVYTCLHGHPFLLISSKHLIVQLLGRYSAHIFIKPCQCFSRVAKQFAFTPAMSESFTFPTHSTTIGSFSLLLFLFLIF